jgi:predicted ATPase/DNA-binding CsgD family transcriptional regulator
VSSFVGRREQIDAIANGLRSARLVTLTGGGGVGKSRLALRVAREVGTEHAYSAWATLGAVGDGACVAGVVAAALGARAWATVDRLVSSVRDHGLLLVLDNCEHLIDACAELAARLLQDCAGVRLLATSREPLGVPGEMVYPVAPLVLPEPDEPFDRQTESEAVQLFVERARAREPRFRLTPDAGELAVRICRSLEGIPLAIELAAARTTTMTLAEIARRLDDPLGLLTGGGRAAPVRQQTLRASLDWSHALLRDPEQRLLRRLAIFGDGFTLEAAEAVCTADDLPVAEVAVLLDRLVAQSLVHATEHDATTRFHLFEAVRQYGLERLGQAGEAACVRERHRDWRLSLARRVASAEVLDPDTDTIDALGANPICSPGSSMAALWQDLPGHPVGLQPASDERPHPRQQAPEPAPRTARSRRPSVLSEREREVAMLIASGRSNGEIAEELVITKKTAEAHVSHILTKLGLCSRVQIATWSLLHGLGPAGADLVDS